MIPMVWYEVTWYWKEKDMEPYTTPPEWVPEIKELDHLIGTQKWVTEVLGIQNVCYLLQIQICFMIEMAHPGSTLMIGMFSCILCVFCLSKVLPHMFFLGIQNVCDLS